MTIWRFWISDCMFCYLFKYLLLTVQMWSFACRVCVSVCVCVWERERERDRHTQRVISKRASTDGKTKDIINCLFFHFESWSSQLWKGALNFDSWLWCSAMLYVSWPIRADYSWRKEGICRKRSVWEVGIEDLK